MTNDWENNICIVIMKMIKEAIVLLVSSSMPATFVQRKSVSNEIVLITGAGSGIGRLLALRFGKLGSRLVLWDINDAGNNETKQLVEEFGAKAYTYTVDITKRDQIYRTAVQVMHEVGDVDVLINNAGIVQGRMLMDTSDELIEKTFNVNAISHFFTTKAFISSMLEANHGHIVEIASIAGKCGAVHLTDYCASKFAVVGFASSLTAELRAQKKYGVHVTTVCPFLIATDMFKGAETSAPRMLSVLEPDYVADQIVDAVLTNTTTLYLPRICGFFVILQALLPARLQWILNDYYRFDTCMAGFVH